ncbi:hypothetical protein AL042_18505 [Pseudomonas amygdali pv. aesculi]|nr:hypothetical protein AL041_11045 [Pseudomonas amygdali pv. aesculi]KWT24719.1 hypothetical protein AL042_18505 [Pseudomonas amygdali pv. aesculi]
MGPGHQLFKVSQEAISASLLFLAGIFEFGEGLLHARNAHGEGGWLKELSVPRVGTVGYFCSASLGTVLFQPKIRKSASAFWISRTAAPQTIMTP